MRKTLSSYGVTRRHGPRHGDMDRGDSRRATKRYFHGVTATRAQIKAKRKRGRRGA